MAYKSSDYQKAINILERRREKAVLDAENRRQEIMQKIKKA